MGDIVDFIWGVIKIIIHMIIWGIILYYIGYAGCWYLLSEDILKAHDQSDGQI